MMLPKYEILDSALQELDGIKIEGLIFNQNSGICLLQTNKENVSYIKIDGLLHNLILDENSILTTGSNLYIISCIKS